MEDTAEVEDTEEVTGGDTVEEVTVDMEDTEVTEEDMEVDTEAMEDTEVSCQLSIKFCRE